LPPVEPRTRSTAPPPPAKPPAQVGGSIAAATAAPAGTLAGGLVAGVLTVAAIRAIVSATVNALRKLSALRFVAIGALVHRSSAPIATPTMEIQPPYWRRHPLEQLADDERAREVVFRRRQLVRVRRDLPKVLALLDERRRLERLQGLVGREAQYTRQRLHAIEVRAVGVADSVSVERSSPAGGVWELGRTLHHTPGCLFLHGHTLAWPALRSTGYVPPVHLRCDCRLRAIDSAVADGLAPRAIVPTIADTLALIARARAFDDA
jgi:hypothetical protein